MLTEAGQAIGPQGAVNAALAHVVDQKHFIVASKKSGKGFGAAGRIKV